MTRKKDYQSDELVKSMQGNILPCMLIAQNEYSMCQAGTWGYCMTLAYLI